MNSARIKTVLLILLFMLNVFLIIPVINKNNETIKYEEKRSAALIEMLENYGITLDSGQDFSLRSPKAMTLTRDLKSEYQLAAAFVGKCESKDLGGNVWFYRSDDAEAVFRGTGESDILINNYKIKIGPDPIKTCSDIMKNGGASISEGSYEKTVKSSDIFCNFNLSYGGFEVFNAPVSFDFCSGYLQLVSISSIFSYKGEVEYLQDNDVYSAVINFLDYISGSGHICSKIERIDCGYIKIVTVSGECRLKPVWRFMTDTGTFLFEAETGKII